MLPAMFRLRGVLFVSLGLQAAGLAAAETPATPVIWYRQPARRWLEALPVGNGRLGAMVFGGASTERIALNESTFWSGAPDASHDNPAGRESLGEIRKLFFAGDFAKGVDLTRRDLLGREGNYGTHLPVGDLVIEFRGQEGAARDYRRELNLDDGAATVAYSVGGARYTREVIASHPDRVMVARFAADQPGRVSFQARFKSNSGTGLARSGDSLAITAEARERKHSNGTTGVSLRGLIRARAEGGVVTAHDDVIEVRNADSATLVVALDTTFQGGEPGEKCAEEMREALKLSDAELRARHQADHQELFRRVALDLGGSPEVAGLPTDERLARLRQGLKDPALLADFFQYGRYLLIAGSREDSPLPTNLQGLWNDNLACNMGWTCDFHLDINTEQNYWPAEVCNLQECHEPLYRLVESLREPGRRTARTVYGARGWVCHVFTNPWGYTAPGWGLGWGMFPTGGIWLASDLWQHYLFTGDVEFLRRRAYPTLKEAAEFFLDCMVEEPRHGWLVTGPSASPENAFVTPNGQGARSEYMGPTCDIVLVRDLFNSCVEACRALGVDAEFRGRLEAALKKLPPLRVGKHGQLMEWLEDFEEADPTHRHTSHLIALFPSDQITPRTTPELARAARVTLERRIGWRGWEDVEWSRGNMICFFARLGDGEEAERHLLGLLREDTDTDLLTYSRGGIAGAAENIFCVDGNSAGTAGVAEMLMQSQGGVIDLLPATPRAWPEGRVRGLRARGGFTVDFDWTGGRVTDYHVFSPDWREVDVRMNGVTKRMRSERRQR